MEDVPPLSVFLSISVVLLLVASLPLAHAHNDDPSSSTNCERNVGTRIQAAFVPGVITVDGNSSDWLSIPGQSFTLLQAINPEPDHPYPFGQLNIKVVHDGINVFFLLEVPGQFLYAQGQKHKCPSVALMFGIGDDAAYYNMGGCHETWDTCSSTTCKGHEVDIMHFSVHNAIAGRLYGANLIDNMNGTGKDSFGNLNDLFAWNAHCHNFDGLSPNGKVIGVSQNDWHGAWSHSSIDISYGLVQSDSPYSTSGRNGTYVFEFVRPLRTTDHLQQDAQFTIGNSHRFVAALWYPVNNVPWESSEHYSASCDWLHLDILPATTVKTTDDSFRWVDAVGVFSLLCSMAAFAISATVGLWVRTKRGLRFQSIESL